MDFFNPQDFLATLIEFSLHCTECEAFSSFLTQFFFWLEKCAKSCDASWVTDEREREKERVRMIRKKILIEGKEEKKRERERKKLNKICGDTRLFKKRKRISVLTKISLYKGNEKKNYTQLCINHEKENTK